MIETVCVLGLGYVGLPTAAMFATHGKQVVGVDIKPEVLRALSNGDVHIEEPGLATFTRAALASGRLVVRPAPQPADAFVLAVPTPLGANCEPDLDQVFAAAESILPVLRPGNLVVLESTCPPGTTARLARVLERGGLRVGVDVLLAYSPERVLPGRILVELVENDRVVGGQTPEAAEASAALYRAFVTGAIHCTDAATAELVKLLENTYRDVNIALANEFARLADVVGVDVHQAIRLANHHPRVEILRPGPGVGGHCIAVDPWFLVQAAPEVARLIPAARAVNDSQPGYVAGLIRQAVADLPDAVVVALGLAYKADVDDLRESPALRVVEEVGRQVSELRLHDALARTLPDGTRLDRELARLLEGADLIVLLTDHAAYRRLDPFDPVFAALRHRRLLDTRDCVDADRWRAAGFTVYRLGAAGRAGLGVRP